MKIITPCPFCGSQPIHINKIIIKCQNCTVTMFANTEEEVIERWNNRHDKISLLQYQNLRKHFQKLIDDVLGFNYYNEGIDVYTADEFACRDLKAKLKKN